MISKQKNFYLINNLYKLFNSKPNDIIMVVHCNDFNVMQYNILKNFCQDAGIENKSVKINLLKKLTKNPLFLNLFSGPTRLFFFQTLDSFLLFEKKIIAEKKFIPLAILYRNEIFSYPFFNQKISSFQNLGNLTSENLRNQLTLNLTTKNSNFIRNISYGYTNFINFLTHIKDIKKN